MRPVAIASLPHLAPREYRPVYPISLFVVKATEATWASLDDPATERSMIPAQIRAGDYWRSHIRRTRENDVRSKLQKHARASETPVVTRGSWGTSEEAAL